MKIQYRGTSDIVRLNPGEDWDGRLATPLSQRVEWNRKNRHIIDTEEAGLSPEAVTLILEDAERFLDVTDLEIIPANGWQKMWGGIKGTSTAAEAQALVLNPEANEPVLGQDPPVTDPTQGPPADKDKNKSKDKPQA